MQRQRTETTDKRQKTENTKTKDTRPKIQDTISRHTDAHRQKERQRPKVGCFRRTHENMECIGYCILYCSMCRLLYCTVVVCMHVQATNVLYLYILPSFCKSGDPGNCFRVSIKYTPGRSGDETTPACAEMSARIGTARSFAPMRK